MKKKITSIAAAAAALTLSAALLAGCAGGGDKPAAGDDEAAAGDAEAPFTLVVGFDAEYPPYGYMDQTTGEYVGLDLDLAAEVAKRQGWEIELYPMAWDAKDALLGDGTITCIWNGFTYEGREDKYAWSEPYMLNGQVVVAKADSGIASIEDLAGKNVMTQIDSAGLQALQDEANADLVASFAGGAAQTIDTYNNAFMQLESGLVDAVVCDLSMAGYQMAAKEGVFVRIGELASEHYAIGFKLGNEELANTVTATLKEMVADGTAKQIVESYADEGATWEGWCLK